MRAQIIHIPVIIFFLLWLDFNSTHTNAADNSFISNDTLLNTCVAKVGNIEITAEEFINSYDYGPAFVKRKPGSKQRYLNYMINEKLLSLKGYEEGIDTSEQASEMFEVIKNDLATEELFKEDILTNLSINEAEIDTVVKQKQIELEIKWLYTETPEEMISMLDKMKKGVAFDTLFYEQISDSVFIDMRSMKSTRYQLGKKNPALAGIIDTLEVGSLSTPIHTDDGWYLIRLENVWRNLITTETENNKLRYEAKQAVIKDKMDKASDKYVHELMLSVNPIIRRNSFTLLRSYLGNFVLPKEKFNEWNLSEKMDSALKQFENLNEDEYPGVTLVDYGDGKITLEDFLIWYRTRSQYVKLNKSDLPSFSVSLEQTIWRMVRDELLTAEAKSRGMYKKRNVVKHANWWRDKITYSAYMNKLRETVLFENEEIKLEENDNSEQSEAERLSEEMTKKIFRELVQLKRKYNVEIYEDVLDKLNVSTENDPKAIELYTVKKGGLLPRTPYPTIDFEWSSWE